MLTSTQAQRTYSPVRQVPLPAQVEALYAKATGSCSRIEREARFKVRARLPGVCP
jgi:hypothetical protein